MRFRGGSCGPDAMRGRATACTGLSLPPLLLLLYFQFVVVLLLDDAIVFTLQRSTGFIRLSNPTAARDLLHFILRFRSYLQIVQEIGTVSGTHTTS